MATVFTSLTLGLLASFSPCILPLYPGFLAYLSSKPAPSHKSSYFLGFFVLSGVLTMMLAIGGIIALLSVSIGSVLSLTIPVADVLITGMGILLILDINPFKMMSQIRVPVLSHPLVNAFVYGLLYAPIAFPCSGPLVVGIFVFSFTVRDAIGKLSAFLWFGIGFGLPLLVLSLLSGALQRQISRLLAIHARKVSLAGGILLVAVGFYNLWTYKDLIRMYLFKS